MQPNELEYYAQSTVLKNTIAIYFSLVTHRNIKLFTQFLPQGYLYVTLSSVPIEHLANAMFAKLHLGMLITLLDDLADNPTYYNPDLLKEIHSIPIQLSNNPIVVSDTYTLAHHLINQIMHHLHQLPGFYTLKNIFEFDLNQFYNANYYCSLLTAQPNLLNMTELRQLRPYNMGMVIAGMIDIMASPHFAPDDIGRARELLLLGQRFGSICNNIVTLQRELVENDITNEMIAVIATSARMCLRDMTQTNMPMYIEKIAQIQQTLVNECDMILKQMNELATYCHSLDSARYSHGLQLLKQLHISLQGVI